MGLTSRTYDDAGGLGSLRGYGSTARNVPGFAGHVPGKRAENVIACTWTKANEQGLVDHFAAQHAGPKKLGLATKGGTLTHFVKADCMAEIPIKSRSHSDVVHGFSDDAYVGAGVDPAGRCLGQESYGLGPQPPPKTTFGAAVPIHGYAGWVPGRVGESVCGERQCQTNHVADVLWKKNRMRVTQR